MRFSLRDGVGGHVPSNSRSACFAAVHAMEAMVSTGKRFQAAAALPVMGVHTFSSSLQVQILYALCDWRIHECPRLREFIQEAVRACIGRGGGKGNLGAGYRLHDCVESCSIPGQLLRCRAHRDADPGHGHGACRCVELRMQYWRPAVCCGVDALLRVCVCCRLTSLTAWTISETNPSVLTATDTGTSSCRTETKTADSTVTPHPSCAASVRACVRMVCHDAWCLATCMHRASVL